MKGGMLMCLEQQQLGVAVVGLGVGEQHARAYQATGSCQLRWLYDLDLNKAENLAVTLGEGTPTHSFEQILRDPTVDIVSIASYDDAHCVQVVAALEAGKHVFVEKPLCQTVEELTQIKTVWKRYRGTRKLSSNLILRAAPVYEWLKQKIATGDFGTIYALDGEYLYGRIEKITTGWRHEVPHYSVIQGGGIHLMDLSLWLMGERPTSVYAAGNRLCTQQTAFRFLDYVTATLRYPSGVIGRITANFGCVHRHHHVLRVFGTAATFLYDDAGPRLHVSRDPAMTATPVSLAPLPAGKGELIAPFVAAVIADDNLDAHTQAIFDVSSVCAACDESLYANAEVEVAYV
jgi:predicted dehydrogenase